MPQRIKRTTDAVISPGPRIKRTGVFHVPVVKAMRLIPLIKAELPEACLWNLDESVLLSSVAAFVQRVRTRYRTDDHILQAAKRELSKMVFADPSSSISTLAGSLASHNWDHSKAIIQVIRSQLQEHSEAIGIQLSDKSIARAFRCSVRKWNKEHTRSMPHLMDKSVSQGCVQRTVRMLCE